jgi:hypothetical protein
MEEDLHVKTETGEEELRKKAPPTLSQTKEKLPLEDRTDKVFTMENLFLCFCARTIHRNSKKKKKKKKSVGDLCTLAKYASCHSILIANKKLKELKRQEFLNLYKKYEYTQSKLKKQSGRYGTPHENLGLPEQKPLQEPVQG